MDDTALAALKGSIEHWRENASAERPEDAGAGSESCALCKIFAFRRHCDNICVECPVMIHTGRPGCTGTPWRAAMAAYHHWEQSLFSSSEGTAPDRDAIESNLRDRFHQAAKAEYEFLESLLPKETE